MALDQLVQINAKPHPMQLNPGRTAVIVVDMENDFGAVGGMFHRAGLDISRIQAAIVPTAGVLAAARRARIPVVYLKMAFSADLSDIGPERAPNRDRHLFFGVGQSTEAPDGTESRVLIRDTWNTEIVSELRPAPDDMVVYKHRFSGFFETELDALLRSLGVTDLIFTGCTTSVCVESTLRDAMFRDYRCLLLEDCTAEPIGDGLARTNHEASLLLIETLFGWVSDSAELIAALEESAVVVQAPTLFLGEGLGYRLVAGEDPQHADQGPALPLVHLTEEHVVHPPGRRQRGAPRWGNGDIGGVLHRQPDT